MGAEGDTYLAEESLRSLVMSSVKLTSLNVREKLRGVRVLARPTISAQQSAGTH